MGKYIGPRLKIIRRLGLLPGLTHKKLSFQMKTAGEHGKNILQSSKRLSLADDYRQRLIEKQKLRFNYFINERQLLNYYLKAKRKKGATGTILLQLLESRLDCILYRLGFAITIIAARQIINHGHILVNNKVVTIPSFLCNINDLISIKEKAKSKNLVAFNFQKSQEQRAFSLHKISALSLKNINSNIVLPSHLSINLNPLTGKVISTVVRNEVIVRVKDLKVVEYYSR